MAPKSFILLQTWLYHMHHFCGTSIAEPIGRDLPPPSPFFYPAKSRATLQEAVTDSVPSAL